jgi:hypothetical protein
MAVRSDVPPRWQCWRRSSFRRYPHPQAVITITASAREHQPLPLPSALQHQQGNATLTKSSLARIASETTSSARTSPAQPIAAARARRTARVRRGHTRKACAMPRAAAEARNRTRSAPQGGSAALAPGPPRLRPRPRPRRPHRPPPHRLRRRRRSRCSVRPKTISARSTDPAPRSWLVGGRSTAVAESEARRRSTCWAATSSGTTMSRAHTRA